MEHDINTYNDVKRKIESPRVTYTSSGLNIRLKTEHSTIEEFELYSKILSLDPNKYLS